MGKSSKNKHKKLVVIDPRKSETAKHADMWIDIRPKRDLIFLYTLANLLIEKDWIDKEYIEKYTENFKGFKEHVKKFKIDDVEDNTVYQKKNY